VALAAALRFAGTNQFAPPFGSCRVQVLPDGGLFEAVQAVTGLPISSLLLE
jgi:hypothetical protein